jgi:hypothetical protein
MKHKHEESGNPQLSSKKPHFHPTEVALEKVPYTLKSCSTTTQRRKAFYSLLCMIFNVKTSY